METSHFHRKKKEEKGRKDNSELQITHTVKIYKKKTYIVTLIRLGYHREKTTPSRLQKVFHCTQTNMH